MQRVQRLLVLLLILTPSLPAAAQSTRVDAIAEEQAEKAKGLGVEEASDAERIVRRVLLSPLLGGGDGMYPWFGSVYDGTGMAVGAGYFKSLEKAAFVNLQAGISINNSMMLRAAMAAPGLWRGMLQVDASTQWVDARRLSFYGFGQDSLKANRTNYDYSPFEVSGNATLKQIRGVFLTAGYGFFNLDSALSESTTPGESASNQLAISEMPGLGADIRNHVIRGTVAYDWRTSPGYSTRGGFYRFSFGRTIATDNQPYSYTAQDYEVVQLVPLVREQFVFAARALMTVATPDEGDQVPFMLMPHIGSGRTLRGYSNRRFTDSSRVLLTAEYRWRPSRYLDMAVFVDSGQVAADRRNFRLSDFDTAWGIGARFHGPTFNAFRVEVARGREGYRINFSSSQPF
jgi:hypothetical protein